MLLLCVPCCLRELVLCPSQRNMRSHSSSHALIRQVASVEVFLFVWLTMNHPNVMRGSRTMAETSPFFSLWGPKVNRDPLLMCFACSFRAPQNTACTLYLVEKRKKPPKRRRGRRHSAAQCEEAYNRVQISFTTQTGDHYPQKEGPPLSSELPPRQQSPLSYEDARFVPSRRPAG